MLHARSSFRIILFILVSLLITNFAIFAQTDKGSLLKFVEVETGAEIHSIPGLDGARSIVNSSDDKFVYIAGYVSDDISVFSRDLSSGDLTYIARYQNNTGIIAGLDAPRYIALSPDGNNLYVAAYVSDAVVVFDRNSNTGELTYLETHFNDDISLPGLNGALDIKVSPDNEHVYVTGYVSDAVVVFDRNTSTGRLSYVETIGNDYKWNTFELPTSGNTAFADVFSIDANTVWIIGENDLLIKTADGGGSWESYSIGTGRSLNAVFFVDADNGWIVGSDDTIIKSTDGGSSWGSQNPNLGNDFYGVHFFNGTTGWVVGSGGIILKTTDGSSWNTQTSNTSEDLFGVFFTDANNGWAVGNNGTILATVDGGDNWAVKTSGTSVELRGIHFTSSTVGWVSGNESTVLKTTNGGTDWTAQTIPIASDGKLWDIYFADSNKGWAVGNVGEFNNSIQSAIVYTADGGTTWTTQIHPFDRGLKGVHFTDANNGWIAGAGNSVFSTTVGGVGGSGGIEGPRGFVISNDGSFIYVTSANSVIAYSRDNSTGALSFDDIYQEGINDFFGLDVPRTLDISPDDKHLYVSDNGRNAITLFTRNTSTGKLTFNNYIYTNNEGGIHGLNTIPFLKVSLDGNYLYAVGRFDDALVVFSRNSSTGELTYLTSYYNNLQSIAGMDNPYEFAISNDGNNCYVSGYTDDTIVKFIRNSSTGTLTFSNVVKKLTSGINGTGKIVFSSDGKHVYVTGNSEDNIAFFTRNPGTGELTYIESYQNLVDGFLGINDIWDLTLSQDGKNIYATGLSTNENAVAAFTRDDKTGKLTYLETLFNGQDGISGLSRPHTSNLRPDGKFLYISNYGGSGSMAVFERNPATGRLTFVESLLEGQNGVSGLRGGGSNEISSDGKFLYQAGLAGDAIAVFRIDEETGKLTQIQVVIDNTDGVDGLDNVTDLTISPDEKFLYGGSQRDHAIVLLKRDQTTGLLTFVKSYFDEQDGLTGLQGARGIKVSPDGGILIVGGRTDDAVSVFNRNRETGELDFIEMYRDEVDGYTYLDGPVDVELSPDNKHVYVATEVDDAINVFSVNFLFNHIGDKTTKEGEEIEFQVTSPLGNYRNLSFWADLSGLPAGAVASFNVNTGKFHWNPSFLHAGTYTVVFYVSDGVLTLAETLTITVADRNLKNEKVFNDTTIAVNSSLGGRVQISSGGVFTKHAVDIPPGAIIGSKSIIVQQPSEADIPITELEKCPSAVSFIVEGSEGGFTFRDSVELTMEFLDFEVKNKKENMRVHIWDIAKQIWQRVRGDHVINHVDNTVKIKINHFSIYGVIEVNDTTSSSIMQPGWSMISLPVSPEDVVNPVSIFSDDIAPFRYETNNSNIYEYNEALGEWVIPTELSNGTGYILYAFDPSNVDVTGLQETADITSTLTYTNSNGWHMLGNPYGVDIDWDDDVAVGSGMDNVYYRWTGSEYDFYLGNGLPGGSLTSTIAPWSGFWVRTNQDAEEVTISYPGVGKMGGGELLELDWRMKISAESGENIDTHNYIGMADWADPRFDRGDVFELVSLNDEFISLSFPHNGWETNPGYYTQDIRKSSDEGSSWDFIVMTNSSSSQVTVNWDIPDIDNSELGFMLIDELTGDRIDMQKNSSFTFNVIPRTSKSSPGPVLFADDPTDFTKKLADDGLEQRRFKIVLSKDTRTENDVIPDDYTLKQNFPNPFNPKTTIEFGLPQTGHVKLAIYNSLGQELRTLVNTEKSAGYHKVVWNGKDNSGMDVSSGMYFYKLISSSNTKTMRLILLR
ncbi:beta-propeller fold lactonase family protein [candidate division KSB1 bacterium]